MLFILFDIGAQANIWRIIAVSERRAQDIANAVLPGLGYIFAIILLLGGLPFNIGNTADVKRPKQQKLFRALFSFEAVCCVLGKVDSHFPSKRIIPALAS